MTTSSDDPASCPIPNTHDKLQEAHWYLHQMQEHYHDPDLFRYSCNAFLQAARSITFMLQGELGDKDGAKEWYATQQPLMRENADLRLLNDLRVQVVHKEPLLLASKARITYLKYSRDKLSLEIPIPTWVRSIDALIRHRNFPLVASHPQRAFIGEEVGVIRRWTTPSIEDRELVRWAIECWAKLAEVVDRAHHLFGQVDQITTACEHLSVDYMVLRESSVFPEVMSLWHEETPPMMAVGPKDGELALRSRPDASAAALYRLQHSEQTIAVGWIGPRRPEGFNSMLLVKVGGKRIHQDSAVYFDPDDAVTRLATDQETTLADTEDADAEASNRPKG